MISPQAAPAPARTGGGRDRRDRPGGSGRRRARNRRYRRNRASRSLLHVIGWNAEGLRSKVPELQRWLHSEQADVVAVQECQFSKSAVRLPGFQPPVVTRRARGRQPGARARGGDVAIYVRAGIPFAPLEDRPLATADDTTEVCGIRIFGRRPLDIINVYRPPIRAAADDLREDHFDPEKFPNNDDTIILGDFNAHHPEWDNNCDTADEVGQRVAAWLDRAAWSVLNNGEATFASYRTGSRTAPDLATCSASLARRTTWKIGPDLGSDHLPMLLTVRDGFAAPHRVRKTKWQFKKADWANWVEHCENALTEAVPETASTQDLCTRLTTVLQQASSRFIPRGARSDPKPWALDPELVEAAEERKAARERVREDDPDSKQRWIQAKKHAAEVESRVSRAHFRKFVSEELNHPNSVGRISKTLKKWERATDDEHRDGQAMTANGRLLTKDSEKAEAFCQTYAWVSRQVRAPKQDRAAKKKLSDPAFAQCQECNGARTNCCSDFTMEELVREIQALKLKKSGGPDGITNEMLKHLGPVARAALLRLINSSWREGSVPQEWRRATIVPIPKAGKDKRLVGSYRPIALTSHLSKLMERLVLSRLSYAAALRDLIPAEQVGFREGRAVEDSIGRLIQQVQDGWQLPKSRSKRAADGATAQKFVLLAFDFARAYDTVDHKLLKSRLLELGVPVCLVRWTWQFLRDRRAKVEVNGTLSRERIFRAGLPQGSVLSPTLFLLWAAPLAADLRKIPGVTPFLYADDTAALCAGNDIATAKNRAQQAADALVRWAQRSKMLVAGEKTQALVLSQWSRDAVDCAVKVAGKTVTAGDHLKLLGVTFDRLLHFGPHCKALKKKTRPRLAHLRTLTGRDWGLDEKQLRTVANGYVRGALEHAAAAWLPATPPSHVEILEREMRAAARLITGCPLSTPTHAVMAEAGLASVSARRSTLAARFLGKARALPPSDPLRAVADATAPSRLSTVTGWRDAGLAAWQAAGITSPVEPVLPRHLPPWTSPGSVTFRLDVGEGLTADAPPEQKKRIAAAHLASLPQCATWIWTDGSADTGVLNGGAGVYIEEPDAEEHCLRAPAGALCSSYRAELVALHTALKHLQEHPAHEADPIVVCTDSQAALATLRQGPSAQASPLGAAIWEFLLDLSVNGRRIHLQWVPSHCDLRGNERADQLAKEASLLPQETAPLDSRTIHRAAARAARTKEAHDRPPGWYRLLMGDRVPPPVSHLERGEAVDVHQLRAGHWSGSAAYLHRIGGNPSPECAQCSDAHCRASWCRLCREEPDTPAHILQRCPALMATRHRLTGNINPRTEEVRDCEYVAAVAKTARRLQSHPATPP